ncbi:hypothetical protein CBE89_10635 [Corynebacterium striatum]|uniref:Uncharacterized protein n=1 Tax=Corynebacterium striatum TaxID=43770 RepID=A0A2Z2J5K5_CORST|nr:hypothetical protein [Corynebacterium striatum]ART21891.1 hypothetical protein CBE89_10635 [Corynebacterium striatum]
MVGSHWLGFFRGNETQSAVFVANATRKGTIRGKPVEGDQHESVENFPPQTLSFQIAPVDEPSKAVPAQTEANEPELAEADGKVYPFSWWKAGLSAFFLLVGFTDFSADPGTSLFFIIPSAWYLLMSAIYRDKLHKRRWLWVWAVAFACLIIF